MTERRTYRITSKLDQKNQLGKYQLELDITELG